MGLFSRKRTVTAELFALELSVYASGYARNGQEHLAQALGVDPDTLPVPELLAIHFWGACSCLGSLDESTRTVIEQGMEQHFVVPVAEMVGSTEKEAFGFYATRIVEYAEAFNNETGSGPMFHLTKHLCQNLTANTSEPGGMFQQMAVTQYVFSYMKSVPEFVEKYRVTGS